MYILLSSNCILKHLLQKNYFSQVRHNNVLVYLSQKVNFILWQQTGCLVPGKYFKKFPSKESYYFAD